MTATEFYQALAIAAVAAAPGFFTGLHNAGKIQEIKVNVDGNLSEVKADLKTANDNVRTANENVSLLTSLVKKNGHLP